MDQREQKLSEAIDTLNELHKELNDIYDELKKNPNKPVDEKIAEKVKDVERLSREITGLTASINKMIEVTDISRKKRNNS